MIQVGSCSCLIINVFLFNPVYDLPVSRHLGVSHCFSGYVCDGALGISAILCVSKA